MRMKLTAVTTIDDLSILVREDVQTPSHRRPTASRTFHRRGGNPYRWVSEMGGYNSLDYTSQPECDLVGIAVHLPLEEVQLGRERKEGQ